MPYRQSLEHIFDVEVLKKFSSKQKTMKEKSKTLDVFDHDDSEIIATKNATFGEFSVDYVERCLTYAFGIS